MKKHNIYKILERFDIFYKTDRVASSVYITFFNGGFFNIDIQNIIFNEIIYNGHKKHFNSFLEALKDDLFS